MRRLSLSSSRTGSTCRSAGSNRAAPSTPSFGWVMISLCGSRVFEGRRSQGARSPTGCRSWPRCSPSRFLSRSRKVARATTIPGFGRSTLGSRAKRCQSRRSTRSRPRAISRRSCGDATGQPSRGAAGRGIPLADRDHEIRYWLARFDGDPTVTAEWERALAAPPWEGPPVWHHGDLDVRNWLVRDGRISGVIDWGAMGVGDPACDVMVAWKLHSPAALQRSAPRYRQTTRPGSGRVAGFSRRRSRSSLTTRQRTTRPCSTKRRAGSPWFCLSAISSVDFAFWGE